MPKSKKGGKWVFVEDDPEEAKRRREVFSVDDDLRRHFWRGVFDGDGCISLTYNKTKHGRTPQGQVSLVGTTETVDRFYEFCCEFVSTKATPKRKLGGRNMDFFGLHGSKALKICEVLYNGATVFLDRKMKRYVKYRMIFLKHRNLLSGDEHGSPYCSRVGSTTSRSTRAA